MEEGAERIGEEPEAGKECCEMLFSRHGIASINPGELWLSARYLHKVEPVNASLCIGERHMTSHSPSGTVGNEWSVTFIQISNPFTHVHASNYN